MVIWNSKVVIYNYVLCWIYSITKNVVNFNFVPCILWDFIVLGLILSWWKIKHVLDEQVNFASVSQETYLRKSHLRSTCWKLKSHARLLISSVSREGLTHEIPAKLYTWRIFKCDFLTLHPYFIYPYYPQKYERPIQR